MQGRLNHANTQWTGHNAACKDSTGILTSTHVDAEVMPVIAVLFYMQTQSGSLTTKEKEMQPVNYSILLLLSTLTQTSLWKKKNRTREYFSVTVRCCQTYMFHFGLQCKTFGTRSGCQVPHYVFEGLRFPGSTFTTSEQKQFDKALVVLLLP